MKRTALLVLGLLAGAGAAEAQVTAEPWFGAGTWMIRAEFGGVAFTDFQRGTARATSADPELGTFQRRVSARTTATAGGAITYWVFDGWGVRGSVAWAPSGFAVWNEGRAQQVLDAWSGGERQEYAGLSVWFADVAAVFRLPAVLGRVVPYGVVGGGLVDYRAARDAELPPEARERFADGRTRSPAAVLGLGAVIPLERHNLLLTFEVTDHLVRTPLDDTGRGEWFELNGVPVQLEPDPRRGSDGIGLTSNIRLMIGVTLPLR